MVSSLMSSYFLKVLHEMSPWSGAPDHEYLHLKETPCYGM
jgi:hypothetical protein